MNRCPGTLGPTVGLVVVALLAGVALARAQVREVPPHLLVAPPEQARAYAADGPKTIVDLQQFRRTSAQDTVGPGGRRGVATLINLNPVVNAWFLLTLTGPDGAQRPYHLENAAPDEQGVLLDPGYHAGLVLDAGGGRSPCDLWSSPATLAEASRQKVPYVPLCGGRLYLRNPVPGHRTDLEKVVDFLRDRVWGGERIVGLAKGTVFKDVAREKAHVAAARARAVGTAQGPGPARLNPAYASRSIATGSLGIAVATSPPGFLGVGTWYRARDREGVYVSLIEPQAIAPELLRGHRGRVNTLDDVERSALVYLAAFDLGRLDLAYALGTDHPRVDWSPRPPRSVPRHLLPGPDGIGTVKPLVTNGTVTPRLAARTVATFAGGFKRTHGAFKYGELAVRNHGSHYGFIEEGVVFSKLQPELATLYVLDDGSVHMQTWTEGDDAILARVRDARQNGVPLVAWDASAGASVPGALVNRWGPGNWSGSAREELRTVRAGACLQETQETRFLVYAYFSSATPSAMARVFQAYGCRYGMLLDMNAPIHTYLALYPERGDPGAIQHLVQSMGEGDPKLRGRIIPRFLGVPDNRDFFYVTRRGGRGTAE